MPHRRVDGERVSLPWHTLLATLRNTGTPYFVNEGRRTMARQWYFYNGWRRKLPGFNLAARPSPTAPHIRVGRPDHAIDFNGAAAVIDAAARRGVRLTRTVAGEEWHLEADAAQLLRYHREHRHDLGLRTLRLGARGRDVQRLQVMLRELGHYPGGHPNVTRRFGPQTRIAVQNFQRRHNMTPDGIVGPKTGVAIERAYDRRTR